MALDEPNHRLYVACQSGHIVIFDTVTGNELQALSIARGVDDLAFDPRSKRLYAACGEGNGTVSVYEVTGPDNYKLLGSIPSGTAGKTGRLVPELQRYFIAVPPHGSVNAVVLVYKVQ